MISFPVLVFPYSIGVKLITNVVPSLPYWSRYPALGITVNSASESGVKLASNGTLYLPLLVSLKETEDVLCKGDEIIIVSSTLGSVASKIILNFHLPPSYLLILNSIEVLNGLRGSNYTLNSKG